jgi:HK97 family phage portal protein
MAGILATFFERIGLTKRSLENPSTPLSAPDDWLYDALGSFRASSGVNVNSQTALSYAPWWRGVNLISADLGRCHLHKYVMTKGGRQIDYKHPSYRLVRFKPNTEMTAMVFRQTLQHHVLATGNGYAYISRANDGTPLELIPMNPTQIYPIRANGQLWYIVDIPNLDLRRVPPEDIFHLKGLSYDGLIGYSVIAKAREALGEGMAQQTWGSIFYRNNAQPRVVLVVPSHLKSDVRQQLRENWERMHAGLENAHRTAVLSGGMDIKTIQINARDAQFIEGRKHAITEVANFLNIPPSKLGLREQTSYNSLEMDQGAYVEEGVAPWFTKWEEESWDKLLTEDEKQSGRHFFGFDARTLVRAGMQARAEYFVKAVTTGWMSPNDVREEEGMNPREDAEGDRYAQDLRFAWVGGEAEEEPESQPQPAIAGGTDQPFLEVPDIRQPDTYSCGAACAMSVGKFFGVGPADLEDWKKALDTTEENSTRPFAIVKYLSELGLVVTAAGGLSMEDLAGFWRAGHPVICPVQEYGIPSKQASFDYGHYVVVIGVGHGYVFVQDPSVDNVLEGEDADQAPGRMLIAEDTWLKVWHDQDVDGNQYERFGIAVGRELPKLPAPAPAHPEPPAAANSRQQPPAAANSRQLPAPLEARDRTVEEALSVLAGLPDLPHEPGKIAVLMPVDLNSPFDVPLESFADLPVETVQLADLCATEASVSRDRVAALIKDPGSHENEPDMGGLPTDKPYIVRVDRDYVRDGHHLLTSFQVRGLTEASVYVYKGNNQPRPKPIGAITSGVGITSGASKERIYEAHRALLVQALRRMAKRIGTQARRAAKKPWQFEAWCRSTLEAEHAGAITEALGPVLEVVAGLSGNDEPASRVAGELLGEIRASLLAAHREYGSGDLDQAVERVLAAHEQKLPEDLANDILTRAKPDKPARTPSQALEILNRMPDADPDNPGEVMTTLPVDENPPFPDQIAVEDLKDLPTEIVKVRKLVATHARLGRKRVADFIQNPAGYTKVRELAGLPTDRPYVVRCRGVDYVYDGHHRLMAKDLLGIARTEAYFYEWDERSKRYSPDQPRDPKGQFGSGGQVGSNELHSKADQTAKGWSDKLKELPAKVATAAKDKVKGTYAKLENRYGKTGAIAIMGAGLIGVPIPLPGASLLTAAPVIAAAELFRALKGKRDDQPAAGDELTDAEIHELGSAWMKELLEDWQANDLPKLEEEGT